MTNYQSRLFEGVSFAQRSTSVDHVRVASFHQRIAMLQRPRDSFGLDMSQSTHASNSPTVKPLLHRLPYLIMTAFKLACKVLLYAASFWLVQCSSSNWPVTLAKTLKNTLYQGFVFGWDSKCADPIKCEGEPRRGILKNL